MKLKKIFKNKKAVISLVIAGLLLSAVLGMFAAVYKNISGYRRLGNKQADIRWKKENYICYISGIEGREVLDEKSARYSDVNILAVVNPRKHKILLVNTPRDTLLSVPKVRKASDRAGQPEKLDAMPVYGARASVKALNDLYDIKIDCMVRVNYRMLKRIVDGLGGVQVYSECDFETDWGPSFHEGLNDVDGKQALAFVRERHHLQEGDVQRGRDQQYMVQAILDKLKKTKSPAVYYRLLKCVGQEAASDLSVRSMQRLFWWQLTDQREWKIENVTLEGEQSVAVTCSSSGQEIYAYLPSQESVDFIRKKIYKMISHTRGD